MMTEGSALKPWAKVKNSSRKFFLVGVVTVMWEPTNAVVSGGLAVGYPAAKKMKLISQVKKAKFLFHTVFKLQVHAWNLT